MRPLRRLAFPGIVSLTILITSGCATDGSMFQYQSGGLPFMGFTMAVDRDSDADPVVQFADAKQREVRKPQKTTSSFTEIFGKLKAPRASELPEGELKFVEPPRGF